MKRNGLFAVGLNVCLCIQSRAQWETIKFQFIVVQTQYINDSSAPRFGGTFRRLRKALFAYTMDYANAHEIAAFDWS